MMSLNPPPNRMLKSEEFQKPVNNFIEENCMVFDNDSEHKCIYSTPLKFTVVKYLIDSWSWLDSQARAYRDT